MKAIHFSSVFGCFLILGAWNLDHHYKDCSSIFFRIYFDRDCKNLFVHFFQNLLQAISSRGVSIMPIKHTKEDDEESNKVGVLSLVRALTKFLDCIYFRGIFVKWVSLVWH